MKDATLAQGNQIFNLILQKQTPADQLQALLESGLLSDILDANIKAIDRKKFQAAIRPKKIPDFTNFQQRIRPLKAGDRIHLCQHHHFTFLTMSDEHGQTILWPNDDDKWRSYFIRTEDEFYDLVQIIAMTHGLSREIETQNFTIPTCTLVKP